MTYTVNEIFRSIQGETSLAGYTSLFIRFTGCNLRCNYCDTAYAYERGTEMTLDALMKTVKDLAPFHHITLTGGEPLLQKGISLLTSKLIECGHIVRIETNGSCDINLTPPPAQRIVDVKTPASGAGDSFLISNIDNLSADDEIKFVICSRNDFTFVKMFFDTYLKSTRALINISPAAGKVSFAETADFILKELPAARLSIQQHRIIWPAGEPGTIQE